MFVTLKLLVLSYCDISGVLPGGGDDYPPGERPCLPSQSRATAAAWLFCQPQTFSSNCSFPFLCPVTFHLRAAAPGASASPSCWWYSSLSASTAPIFACFAGVLTAGTCNPWDGSIAAPVELVALLSLVLSEREVGCWMKAPAFSELSSHCPSAESLLAQGILRRREVPEKQSTRARLFLKQL